MQYFNRFPATFRIPVLGNFSSLSPQTNDVKGAIFENSRLVSSFLVAIADINKDPNVLPGVQLKAVINITKPLDAFDNLKAGKTSIIVCS